MTLLEEILLKFINLDEGEVFRATFDEKNIKEEIIRLNTEEQLEEKGIDSEGQQLGEYSDFTKTIKQAKGDRFDHITLKDSGEFYKSFNVRVTNNEIIINADPNKEDTNLFEEYGEDILGLTDDSLESLQEETLENLRKALFRELGLR